MSRTLKKINRNLFSALSENDYVLVDNCNWSYPSKYCV